MQTRLVAGDTLNFLTTVADYPASSGWVLKFRLVPRTAGTAVTLSSTAEGDDHRTQATSTTTAAWAAGQYGWSSWVEKAGEVYTLESGQITIAPDPRTLAAGTDTRSEAEAALDAVNAMLKGKATNAVMLYRINDREVRSYSIPELVKLRSLLLTQVGQERRAAGIADKTGSSRLIAVRIR
jgi:hypothetical protein